MALAMIGAVGLFLLVAANAWARPGGGQSYSGGSSSSHSSSSSSSGGGGGDSSGLIQALIWLIIEYPAVGIPVTLIVIGVFIWSKVRDSSSSDWSTGAPSNSAPARKMPVVERGSPRTTLEGVRNQDPNFSIVLFEDFVGFLFAQVHEARGRGALDELAPYVADNVRAMMRPPPGLRQVKGTVLGAMRITRASITGGQSVDVEFEANMTEVAQTEQAYFVVEQWTLIRRAGARSRDPAHARTLGCPNCGAPRTALRGTLCTQCNTAVGDGAFDWNLSAVRLVQRESRPPLLTGTVEEKGNDLPTLFDPEATSRFEALRQKDPMVSWEALCARTALAWSEMQTAWNAQDLTRARPYLSDAQFQSLYYWVDTYRRSGLRNITENAQITNIELVRVTSDRFYDAVTLRLWATGLDYTLDGSGKVVAGKRNKPRPYTEYWTLVRGSNRKGAPRTDPACPNCGAPLAVNMAGSCQYCNVVVTTGEFDWVVSRIEQDEAYRG